MLSSDNDQNAGMGHYGACCQEMDIWEANSQASAYTVHPCNLDGFKVLPSLENSYIFKKISSLKQIYL